MKISYTCTLQSRVKYWKLLLNKETVFTLKLNNLFYIGSKSNCRTKFLKYP